MSTRVVDRVDDWDEQSFADGYSGLALLAKQRFSGVVRAGGAELYMTKGVVVGIRQGDIEDFDEASGSAYTAPSPALPMLAIMQEGSDTVKDKFYSEKTAIEEVDQTLKDGGFTGYIELSENVLSGDYYIVYHGGESMSVGFVGESKRLIDDDEAFEMANDEVGIYKVRQADVAPIELPAAATDDSAGGTGDGAHGAAAGESMDDADTTEESAGEADGEAVGGDGNTAAGESASTASADSTASTDRTDDGGDGSQSEVATTGPATEQATPASTEASGSGTKATGREENGPPHRKEGESVDSHRAASTESVESDHGGQGQGGHGRGEATASAASGAAGTGTEAQQGYGTAQQDTQGGQAGTPRPAGGVSDGQRGRTAQQSPESGGRKRRRSIPVESLDLETRAIPSLDPGRTQVPEQERSSGPERDRGGRSVQAGSESHRTRGERRAEARGGQEPGTAHAERAPEPGHEQPPETAESADRSGSRTSETAGEDAGGVAETEDIEQLREDLESRESRIEELEEELGTVEADRDELSEELESVKAERDRLAGELNTLESELERLETELGAATDGERRMTPGEALRGTDVFVRYHSKGEATLEKAHAGKQSREEVNENLRLEKHTQFDNQAVAVGGRSYDEFLDSTVEYQFVEWIVRELLFEIRDTGNTKQLGNLYDVLPKIDRGELAGIVEVTYTEDGEKQRRQESFDIVLRNRMGNPLLVANLNDSREAATEAMMEDLITAAERVGKGAETFAGAFLVTTSFFDPGALEIASEATQGGILSRDKRTSFVNITRKQGYHLCLVEARNENFHLAVPDL